MLHVFFSAVNVHAQFLNQENSDIENAVTWNASVEKQNDSIYRIVFESLSGAGVVKPGTDPIVETEVFLKEGQNLC